MLDDVDTQLRKDERRAAQGDDQARTRLLLRRVRAGELSLHLVYLAAYLGEPRAVPMCDVVVPEALEPWLAGVVAADQRAGVRAGLALARAVLEQRRALPDRADAAVVYGLAQVEAWCLDPEEPKLPAWGCAKEARAAALTGSGVDVTLAWITFELLSAADASDPAEAASHVNEALRFACRLLDDEVVRDTVRDALVLWAVGEGDPLKA
jgi:hypothetical protein